MLELLAKLSSTFGPSGCEELIRKVIEEEIKEYVDELRVDSLGNLIGVKKGKGKRVMLAAHMDQIGVIVTNIDDNGFLRFSNIGGLSVHNLIHRRVIFANGVVGVVGYETEIEDIKAVKLNKMYIDIGAVSRDEAREQVNIGDAAVYESHTVRCGGRLVGGAMDNRIGCAVLIETIKAVPKTEHEVYYVFTVQEEVGLRGAKTAAYGLMPDAAIAVDVTLTGDTPKSRPMAIKLGAGPAVKVKDTSVIAHPKIKEYMIERAEAAGIPYQLEVLDLGGTDSGAIHLTREGIPSGVLSIPCRYVHSAHEMVDEGDVQHGVALLVNILEGELKI